MMRNQRRRFLIVDNDEQESNVLVHLFKSLGQEASATWSGRNALDYLASNQLDILMVDQYVADMYVGDLIERVFRLPNHPRVVIMRSGGKCKPIKYDKSPGGCRFFEKGQWGKIDHALLAAFPDLCDAPLNQSPPTVFSEKSEELVNPGVPT